MLEISTVAKQGALFPSYASEDASGADVRAYINEALSLEPGKSVLVPTGLHFAIPRGYEIQVRPRSGLALKHQIGVLNSPGTIDADYRGELGIILMNYGTTSFTIESGMRIAQLVVAPVLQAEFVMTSDLAKTTRGCGGFGHTGF